MENIRDLLDEIKAKKGLKSNNELAAILGWDKRRVSDCYKGERMPDQYICLKIAECLGKTLDEVIATVEVEAEKDESRREAWKRHLKKLGGIAASFMIAALLALSSVTLIMTGDAKAQEIQQLKSGESTYYKLCVYPACFPSLRTTVFWIACYAV